VGSEGMSINELSERLAINQGEILKTLFMKGIMVSVNQVRDPPPPLPPPPPRQVYYPTCAPPSQYVEAISSDSSRRLGAIVSDHVPFVRLYRPVLSSSAKEPPSPLLGRHTTEQVADWVPAFCRMGCTLPSECSHRFHDEHTAGGQAAIANPLI